MGLAQTPIPEEEGCVAFISGSHEFAESHPFHVAAHKDTVAVESRDEPVNGLSNASQCFQAARKGQLYASRLSDNPRNERHLIGRV